jgi:hypothetical protein
MNETRFPCRAHLRLQAKTVTQARSMLRETPASPQTTFISDPFSAKHKLQSPKRKFNIKSKVKSKVKTKVKTKVKSNVNRDTTFAYDKRAHFLQLRPFV